MKVAHPVTNDAYICDYVRTPIGRFGGALSSVRADDLGAVPLRALQERNPSLDLASVEEVIFGCANQAGEDNRNIARMSLLLAGYPDTIPGTTINRLCGSGMDAILAASRAIKSGEIDLAIAGGVESMSRAPFVLPKADRAYSRTTEIHDTTIGWRFVNPLMKDQYGVESMPETAENVAEEYNISRHDQDAFAYASQCKALTAHRKGRLAKEICKVSIHQRNGEVTEFNADEHVRPDATLDGLAKLKTPFRQGGTVTAGNASGVNDGAAALLIASDYAIKSHGLTPLARIVAGSTAGVSPRIMGIGPVPATRRLCEKMGVDPSSFDVIELNEAFASQAIAVLRELGFPENAEHVNPNGGAIALGHPLGMSGARLCGTATMQLLETGGNTALTTMCIGVGQGIAVAFERC